MDRLLLCVLTRLNMRWVVLMIALSTLSSHWLRLLDRSLKWVIPRNEFFVFLLLLLKFVVLLLHNRVTFSLARTFPRVIDNRAVIVISFKRCSWSFLALIVSLTRVCLHFLALFLVLLWGLGDAPKFARCCPHSFVETKTVAVFGLLGGDLHFCHWIWNVWIMSILIISPCLLSLTQWKIELVIATTITILVRPLSPAIIPCRITLRLFSPRHYHLIEASFRIDLSDALTLIGGAKLWQTIIVLSLHLHSTILATKVLSRWFFIQQLLVSVRVHNLLELPFFSLKLFQLVHIFYKLLTLMISFRRSVSISIKLLRLLVLLMIVLLTINVSDSFKFKLIWVLEHQCFLSSWVLHHHVNSSWIWLPLDTGCTLLMVLVVCLLHLSGTSRLLRFLSLRTTSMRGL